jgi:tetratricopeptide (TPR) repeat protein
VKAAALARILRARIKFNAKDFAGAAALLDTKIIRDQTSLADYALFLRGDALEQAGRPSEARAFYQRADIRISNLTASRKPRHCCRPVDAKWRKQAVPWRGMYSEKTMRPLFCNSQSIRASFRSTRALAAYAADLLFVPAAGEIVDVMPALTKLVPVHLRLAQKRR